MCFGSARSSTRKTTSWMTMVPMPVSDAAGPHEDIGDTLAKPEHLAMGEDMTWRVTVLTDDGSWVPVPVEAESMEEAVAAIIDRRGVANVVECEPWDAWSRRHRPRFKVGDAVRFETKWGELSGTVEIVDYRGRERMSYSDRHPGLSHLMTVGRDTPAMRAR